MDERPKSAGCAGCLIALLGLCVFVYALASALGFQPLKWYHDRQASKTCVDHPAPGYYVCSACTMGGFSASDTARSVEEWRNKGMPALCYIPLDGYPSSRSLILIGPYSLSDANMMKEKVGGRINVVSINPQGHFEWVMEP